MPYIVRKRARMSTTITIKEHIDGWSKQKEKIALVISGLTFNDFKVKIKDPYIAQLDYLSRQILLTKGFSSEGY